MLIKYKFCDLNKYINAERTNKFMASKIKKECTSIAYYHFLNQKPYQTPVGFKFTWHVTNQRVDPDNIAFCKKYILDGMVKAKVIPNDNQKHIIGFVDEFKKSDFDGVEIEVI